MATPSLTRLQTLRTPPAGAGGPPAASVDAASIEGRGAPRKTTRSGAVLRFDTTRPQQPVTVQDISATGAKLLLVGMAKPAFGAVSTLPTEFKLVITVDRIEVDCKLAWQRGAEIGVLFQSAFRPVRMVGKGADFARRG